jgi:predicted amidohydrolase
MADGARRLAAIQIDRKGAAAAVYHKIHLSGDEQRWFTRGRRRIAFTLDGWRIAIGVCYDSSFPEHARGYAREGADLYLVGGAFPAGRSDARRAIYMPARALENTMYVAFSNYVGAHEGETYEGRSGVWGPDGAQIADAGAGEGVTVVDLKAADLRAARKATPMLADLEALRSPA